MRRSNGRSNKADQEMTLTHLSDMVPVRQGGRRPATVRLIGNGTVATNFLVQKEIIEVSKLHRMTKRMADEKLASLQEETNSTLGNKIISSERQRKRFKPVSQIEKLNYPDILENMPKKLYAFKDTRFDARTSSKRCHGSVNLIASSAWNSLPGTCFVKRLIEHVSKRIHD